METSTSIALATADKLLGELQGTTKEPAAPTMGRLKRVSYSHEALIDLIIKRPDMTQKEYAAHFGYTEGWISNVLAADAFQEAMDARRKEIVDPELKASIEERFRALTIRSLQILQDKLNSGQVSDNVALRCAELGAKIHTAKIAASATKPESSAERLARLAERLLVLQPSTAQVINGQAIRVNEPQPEAIPGA